MINISSAALQEIKRIQFQADSESLSNIRLSVKSGGCSGMFYDLKLETNRDDSSLQDRTWEVDGVSMIVDQESWQYVADLKLDYSEDLIGGGFRFQNSQIQDVCGCGISFSGKKPPSKTAQ